MALPSRRHRIHFRYPECIGLVLVLLFVSACLYSLQELDKLGWIKAQARIIAVSHGAHNDMIYSPISTTKNGVVVHYEYDVGSRTMTGLWQSSWLSTPIVKNFGSEFMDSIESMENRPRSMDELPRVIGSELMANEVRSSEMISPDLRKSLRGEDFYNVSALRRKSLGGIVPEKVDIVTARSLLREQAAPHSASTVIGVENALVRAPVEISIRFDPDEPGRSTLNYPGFNLNIPVMILNAILLLVLIRYFSHTYPALKMEGR